MQAESKNIWLSGKQTADSPDDQQETPTPATFKQSKQTSKHTELLRRKT